MRVVDRKTFLELPAGTVYAKYGGEPTQPNCVDIGEACIKAEARGENDWWVLRLAPWPDHEDFTELTDAADKLVAGEDLPADFETVTADGLYDQEQLFAVYGEADVDALIARLQRARAEAFGRGTGESPEDFARRYFGDVYNCEYSGNIAMVEDAFRAGAASVAVADG